MQKVRIVTHSGCDLSFAEAEALKEIERNLGKQFDPELGRIFIEPVENGTIQTDIYN